jgi:hypothetical protein
VNEEQAMTSPIPARTVARTVVVGGWIVVLAVAGRPVWLALLMGLVLVGVWAAPLLSSTTRQAVLPAPLRGRAEPREAGRG